MADDDLSAARTLSELHFPSKARQEAVTSSLPVILGVTTSHRAESGYCLPPLDVSSEISFHNLTYSLKLKKKTKVILEDVSGVFGNPEKGEMIAIMGQSGAGVHMRLGVCVSQV